VIAKPAKRYRATLTEWERFREHFALDRCWVCAETWQELHHIYPRSQGGDDDIPNLAPVCRSCHARIEARDPVARSLVRQALMPSNLDYLIGKLGDNAQGWIERNYAVVFACEPCECGAANPECETCYGPRAA
jgi:hypothetical protein